MHHLMVVLIVALVFLSCLIPAYAGTDKTLVSWVHLDNTTQQGGSALTVQVGDQFDGIVFGEKAAGKWMAGSNMWYRTQADQAPNPVELASPDELIQIAVVYEGRQIRIYRNGELTTQYEAENIDLLGSADKSFHRIEGATHYFQGQPALQQRAVDLCRNWLNARGMAVA